MAKLILTPIGSFTQAAVTTINANMDAIEVALENTLSRDGTIPNQMAADLDLNNNDVLNADTVNTRSIILDGEVLIPTDINSGSAAAILTAIKTVDGAGSGLDADLLDGLHSTAFVKYVDTSTAAMQFVIDEDNMASNSATKVPTQQSVKVYVDNLEFKPAAPALIRSIQRKLHDVLSVLDYIPVALHDDIRAGTDTTDLSGYFNAAIADAREVYVPAGKYGIGASGLTQFSEASLIGRGDGVTELFALGLNTNMVRLGNWATVKDMMIRGVYDDVNGGTGVLYQGSYSRAEGVTVQDAGFQGFSYDLASKNFQINTRAIHCGHRGTNMSNNSFGNVIAGYQAENCKRAGMLLGYLCHDNVISDVWMKNHDLAALWVHMQCYSNQFNNVVCDTPSAAGLATPSMYIGAHTYDNQFTNFVLRGSSSRGLYLFNSNVDTPEVGTVNGPTEGNLFKNFKIYGDGTASSAAVKLTSQDSQLIRNNIFDGFYVHNWADGVSQDDAGCSGNEFTGFRFGTITNKKFRGGLSSDKYRTAKLKDFAGVTGIGALAAPPADTGLEAQPAVPATNVAVANPYPFPVNIYVSGLAGTSGVQINGGNTNGTQHDGGNGTHLVPVGATITLSYTSGTPSWRWWTIF